MTHPEGGFYSAEDADSEGHEGKFYCWTREELSKLLLVEEFNMTARHFGITPEGKLVDHSHPLPLKGQNVLSVVNPPRKGAVCRRPKLHQKKSGTATRCPYPGKDFKLLASAKTKMLAGGNGACGRISTTKSSLPGTG